MSWRDLLTLTAVVGVASWLLGRALSPLIWRAFVAAVRKAMES